MHLNSLTTHAFRNLSSETIALSPRLNLVLGPNGAGKSGLLEAYGVLATVRSFRSSTMRTVAQHGETTFRVAGDVVRDGHAVVLDQVVDVRPRLRRRLLIGGASVDVDEYLSVLPVIVLTGGDRDLVFGQPERRRSFLDRLTFLLDPDSVRTLRRYNAALQQRNAALTDGRQAQLDVWDTEAARLAARVVQRRWRVTQSLRRTLRATLPDLGSEDVCGLRIEYKSDVPVDDSETVDDLAQRYEMEYHRNRERDVVLGFTSLGPHRHDLVLTTNGRRAREVLSSGQGKLAAAALRLSAMELLENRLDADETVPVLMDDADAELDPGAFASVLKKLGPQRQVVLSSAHPEVVREVPDGVNVLSMEAGRVVREGTAERIR